MKTAEQIEAILQHEAQLCRHHVTLARKGKRHAEGFASGWWICLKDRHQLPHECRHKFIRLVLDEETP